MAPASNPIRRYQLLLLGAIVAIIILLIAVQGLADFFTNYLWYRSVHFDDVWRSMTSVKIELAAVFTFIFFVAAWVSLLVVDKVAPRALFMSPEQEVVRRYQALVGRHRFAVRTVISLFFAFIIGNGTSSQWQHWLLFLHGGTFGATDPLFHKDVGYFVFKLPFLSFLVGWAQVSLIVLAILCVAAYYMNGGLRFSGPSPRVDPRATTHFSVIFAALALVRAAGYFYVDRYALDLSNNGLFQGAGYTAVHVRLPALNLLTIVALAAFVLFVYNVYARNWTLPIVAAGLWAFVAIVIGVIFPWAVQSLQVNPAQSTYELPYLASNIAATRDAYNLNGVDTAHFQGAHDATAGIIKDDAASLEDVDLWDPSVSAQTYQVMERLKGFYSINAISLDRYTLDTGPNNSPQLTPVVVGVREVAPANLNRTTWVNTHLVDTHGYGVVMAPANTTNNLPQFPVGIQGIPIQEAAGAPAVQQPDIYYGVGETGYVIVHSAQGEYDYQSATGSVVYNSYPAGPGGIRIGSIWQKMAFALRFHDFNLLVSKLVTPNSRIMFNQDVGTLVQKVAPFLQVDANPYPVIDNGQIDWIVDAYTTTNYYPYSQSTAGTGLAGSLNYVRNSVKAVVNAYTGQVTLYAWVPSDPILRTWMRIFPLMFKPKSDMDAVLRAHLRYPQNLLSVESTMFGKYHITNAASFYNNSGAWQAARTGTSPVAPAVQPTFQLLQLPGEATPTFGDFLPLVPRGGAQNLTAFLVADCSYANYGQLTAYSVQQTNLAGPALADGQISANNSVTDDVTLLDQHGSTAVFGPTLVIPIDDSLLYVRALFGVSSSTSVPQLDYITVDYGGTVAVSPQKAGGTPELLGPTGALTQVIGPSIAAVGQSGPTSLSAAIVLLIKQAETEETAAYAALKTGDLATYGADEEQLKLLLSDITQQLAKLEAHKGSSGTSTTTTTTTPSSTTTTTVAHKKRSSATSTSVGGA
jgi:uncharacterized membrane protein (UPF0182 family)